ncbi:protein FAR1-RELATED SEQUENCE 1-like [Camellia sinensis]|uniref:protein FAR1-RELATED SEQUENCE 1-like n=1 Tax=Camellia sinensis TaxID=4442 RepID=UPI0010359382|nr:protein FAR1-RELATED SEQUENCE 1-like [Camellia sinensis]
MVVSEKMKHVDFVVYFNSTECEVQCICRLFEFRGIMCAHSLAVLVRRCINEVPSKYILPWWRKDVDREYACIKTTYTGFGNDFNASTYERINKKFIAIVQLAGNSEGKTRIVDLGLDEIKERVMKEESDDGSNLPCSTRSPIHTSSTQGGTSRKVISPLVARRRGRPVTKRKIAKVDQIVNRFKAAKLLRFECEAQAQTPYYPYMVGTENSMYVPVAHGIRGTSLTPSDFISGTRGSLMSAPTQIYGSASGSLDITDLFAKLLIQVNRFTNTGEQMSSSSVSGSSSVYDCLTRAEFESKWEEMLATFNLYDNEWLGVLYDERNRQVPVYVKDIFWAGMSTTQRSESTNAFFDGYVNPKATLKQFIEQYDNALRNKVEKEKKANFKSRHKLFDCLTIYGFEKQFQQTYTNAKFKEVQGELKRLVYCQAVIVKDERSISTYNV